MVYYPLATLMLGGIRDILIISTREDIDKFENILGDGNQLGINISYKIQKYPKGLADAFIVGEEFIGSDPVCLILGDNIFYGHGLSEMLLTASKHKVGATIFGYYVKDPERYGVVEFDTEGKALTIEEKPCNPQSNYAVVGLYYYDNNVVEIAKNIRPSDRGEIEITAVNNEYMKNGKLHVEIMGRGYAWLDTGTHNSMLDAAIYVRTIEERQGLKISCIEEIAYRMGYIDGDQLKKLAEPLLKSGYGNYLLNLLRD